MTYGLPDDTDTLVDLALNKHRAQKDRAYQQLHKAVMLAPSLEVCEALLRGQTVPVERLDPVWARRYGLL